MAEVVEEPRITENGRRRIYDTLEKAIDDLTILRMEVKYRKLEDLPDAVRMVLEVAGDLQVSVGVWEE